MHKLINLFKTLGNQQVGYLRFAVCNALEHIMPRLFVVCGEISNIHKLINIDKIIYHLGGYGLRFEEAFIKFQSEVLERYSLILFPEYIKDDIIYASYKELEASCENIPPYELLQFYSDTFYKNNPLGLQKLEKKDVIGWIPAKSLFNPNKEILFPAQMLFPSFVAISKKKEKMFFVAFSTGTASQTTLENALLNALYEYIEIDAVMINWYTLRKSPRIDISGTLLEDIARKIINPEFYDLILLYQTLPDIKVHVVSAFIVNKKNAVPILSFGAHADLDPYNATYRGLIEASATAFLGVYAYFNKPEIIFKEIDYTNIMDIDTNVIFYALPKYKHISLKLMRDLTGETVIHLNELKRYSSDNIRATLQHLIRELRKISEWAIALEITLPDIKELGFRVVRVFIPELYCLCLPSFPYDAHKRILKYGGVKNEFPHPLP